jgi:hypothetical protein
MCRRAWDRGVSSVGEYRRCRYAEAVKTVEKDGSMVKDPERILVSSRSVPEQRERPTMLQ